MYTNLKAQIKKLNEQKLLSVRFAQRYTDNKLKLDSI